MNDTMHAISQDELGGPEVLTSVTVARPEPDIGEILVRVHAGGVNPADVLNRQTGVFAGEPPFVPGWDVSGTVEATGPGVTIHRPVMRCSGGCRSRTVTAPRPVRRGAGSRLRAETWGAWTTSRPRPCPWPG